VPDEKLPRMVISNVNSRFRHLETTYSMFPDLVEKQKKRVKMVTDYFADKKR
jgi:hypothetical protein